ncbi:MAG: glycosyl hydrolase, partial [Planctomycetota bacterium]
PAPAAPAPATPPASPPDPAHVPDAKPAETPTAPVAPPTPKVKPGAFAPLAARSIGPAITSGRIGDLAVNPNKTSEWYVAVSSGNLWKTSNAGNTFSPIFDSYGSFAIGCVTLDPSNPATVWVGTGENNSQRSVSRGDGVYVSRDSGKSFTNVGLKESAHVGMIRVDPRDSNVVYVAAMGPLWSDGGERGLYKTTDGGKTWERVLHISDMTGVNEVHMDPRNPDTLYATAYQRRRHVWTLVNGGPESALHKSDDAGKTWRKITSGLPGEDKGRLGLAISPANPDILYVILDAGANGAGKGGVYRSRDRGESWERRSGYGTSSPQYYNELFADPKDPDRVYAEDTFLQVSDDGGATFRRVPEADKHVDTHVVYIDPADTNHLIVGCDGGLYESFDKGAAWRHFPNLPVMQFYRVAVDNALPFYNVYGGTQDNNTIGGPSRTTDRAGITNEDWFTTTGGDGFETVVDPTDPNIVYSESQDGGLVRFDRKNGEEITIKPQEKPGDKAYVFNWDTPLLLSPHKSTRLYFAGNFLFRSDDRGDSWTRISEDLTRGIDRNTLKVMGVIQKPEAPSKHLSTSIYGNAVALAESPLVEGLLFVGTDDGLLHITGDAGKTWRKVSSFPNVPDMTYVSSVAASNHNKDTLFIGFDNHKMGDAKPYLLRSDDRGETWKSIAGNLPERDTVLAFVEDHVNPNLMFCGTEYGCYFTLDAGEVWTKLGGLPTIAVRDLEIQKRETDLVMATFGRGFYVLDDFTALRVATPEMFERKAVIFPVKPALAYIERSRLGATRGRGTGGASYWTAPNPPGGAVITYSLKEKVTSRQERRKEAQKKEDWTYPTVEEFRGEDREQDPRVILTIRDSAERVVRQLDVSRDAGVHRVSWDLRLPETDPASFGRGERAPWDIETGGVMALPGKYSASLSQIVDGQQTELGASVEFEVVDLASGTLAAKGEARTAKFAFEQKASELSRAAQGASRLVGEISQNLSLLRKAIDATPALGAEAIAQHEALRLRVLDLSATLSGDPTPRKRSIAATPSINERVSYALSTSREATAPPTGTQKEQYQFAAAEFEKALAELKSLTKDIRALEDVVEKAGGPWTPGRMPEWKK